jgi:hypothetical protein
MGLALASAMGRNPGWAAQHLLYPSRFSPLAAAVFSRLNTSRRAVGSAARRRANDRLRMAALLSANF